VILKRNPIEMQYRLDGKKALNQNEKKKNWFVYFGTK
jgi:hypothetical protein